MGEVLLTPCETLHFEGGTRIIDLEASPVSGERPNLQAPSEIDEVDSPSQHTHYITHTLPRIYTVRVPFVKMI